MQNPVGHVNPTPIPIQTNVDDAEEMLRIRKKSIENMPTDTGTQRERKRMALKRLANESIPDPEGPPSRQVRRANARRAEKSQRKHMNETIKGMNRKRAGRH